MGNLQVKKKVIFEDDQSEQFLLKRKKFEFARLSIVNVFNTFNILQKNISPHISNLQNHFDLFDAEKTEEIYLQKNDILNAHLYLNAQTRVKHTERDSSYTIISVPPQEKEKNYNRPLQQRRI